MDSQASKHLEWCAKKAKREIEECKKQNKKIRHRGLVKIEPNRKRALEHIEKARHLLRAFQLLKKEGFSDLAMGLGFYSIYHCLLSIASKFGYESRNQACTVALIEHLKEEGKLKIKEEIIELMKYDEEKNHESIIELREDYTYGIDLEVEDKEQINKIEKLCIEFIAETKEIIYERT